MIKGYACINLGLLQGNTRGWLTQSVITLTYHGALVFESIQQGSTGQKYQKGQKSKTGSVETKRLSKVFHEHVLQHLHTDVGDLRYVETGD
jgi:hypothetical protein